MKVNEHNVMYTCYDTYMNNTHTHTHTHTQTDRQTHTNTHLPSLSNGWFIILDLTTSAGVLKIVATKPEHKLRNTNIEKYNCKTTKVTTNQTIIFFLKTPSAVHLLQEENVLSTSDLKIK